jgi:pimeloyl-ACP methyl ester carboxylesterase
MKSVERDGVRIAYEERGSGEAAFVFVHGWCCDHTHFEPQVEHFSRDHRVIALDQRGFGASDKPREPYTIEGFADDLAWLCDQLGVKRPLVVGHSLGGAVALATAARYPDLPSAIVLCDPAVFFPSSQNPRLEEFVLGLASPDYLGVAEHFVRTALFIEGDDEALRERVVEDMLATPQHVMHSAFENLHAFDDEAAARACKVPVLHIDAAVAFGERDRFEACCPQLRVAQTTGSGHFHQLLAPGEVNALIEDFVASVSSD